MTTNMKRTSVTSPLTSLFVDSFRVSICKNELFAFGSKNCYLLSRFL